MLEDEWPPLYVSSLASIVDNEMRKIADYSGVADTITLALLASLSLADQLLKLQEANKKEKENLHDKIVSLTEKLTLSFRE